MNNLSHTIAAGFIHSFEDFGRRLRALAEPLSEEQFWRKPYAYGNSFGNLALHLTGNLNYYIGAQIANSGYVREREREFSETDRKKEEVLRALDEAIERVVATLKAQGQDDWSQEYQAVGVDDVNDRFSIYLRCAVHFHHHLGQMLYLVQALNQAE
jgi:uncharacterized damage-inducible protein DinB